MLFVAGVAGVGAAAVGIARALAAGAAAPDSGVPAVPDRAPGASWPDYASDEPLFTSPDVPYDAGANLVDVPAAPLSFADGALDLVDGALMAVGLNLPGRWVTVAQKPANAAYLDALQRAEIANGIPNNILVRLAYQESRFKPDAFNAKSGATGIMQIVPRWNPGVDPADPFASIAFAGKKLAGLYRMFGTWELALQAYNWGEGNLKKYLAGQVSALPRETANYSAQILADVGTASGVIA